MSIAGEDTDFAYHLGNDGTEVDKRRDMETLYRMLGMGYVGYAPDGLDRIITIYRPFSLGFRQPAGNGVNAKTLRTWIGAGKC